MPTLPRPTLRPLLPPLGRFPAWAWMPAYLAAYAVLDAASYIRPVPGLAITAWNPQQALAIALLIWHPGAAWLVGVGLLVAEALVRGLPANWLATAGAAIALTITFSGMARALRGKIALAFPLARHRELLWSALIVSAGSLASAVLYVLIHGTAQPEAFAPGWVLRYWVGDAVGLVVTLPLLLLIIAPARRAGLLAVLRHPAWWAGAALTCAALWVVFGRGEQDYFKFFYLLLPPVVWAAVRFGVQGAVLALFFTQVALLAAGQVALQKDVVVFELQVLMAATSVTALLLGVAVDERARAEAELRASLRFSAAGQMAAALAHELSQPLTALANYAQACQSLAQGEWASDIARRRQLQDALDKLAGEAQRAGAVTRRLRDFFRTGSTALQATSVRALLQDAMEAHQELAQRMGVRLHGDIPADLPPVRIDAIQIAVVLRNLVVNALESAAQSGPDAQVTLAATAAADAIRIDVTDTGPGIDAGRLQQLFEAAPSGKQQGLGVGLSLSRSIVESHGGKLWAEAGRGGRFSLLLPVHEPDPEPAV